MSFPLDLTVPPDWYGPPPKSKLLCHGISPSANWVGGTCLRVDAHDEITTSQEFAYEYFSNAFAPSLYKPQPLGADLTATCRGISDNGERVGWRLLDPNDQSSTIGFLREHNGAIQPLPFGNDVSAAMGVTAALFPGHLLIVGSHTQAGQRANGFGITYSKLNGFGPEMVLGDSIPPYPNEDVTVQCINSQGDVVVNLADNTVDPPVQRQYIGFRTLEPQLGNPFYHGYKWRQLVQPGFPVDPNTATIVGINSRGDISGFYPNGSKTSGFTVNVKLIGGALAVSGFFSYDHPKAASSTQFSGISDGGLIAGTYDLVHPFVFNPA